MSQYIWNVDETGCRVGVAKNQSIYTARCKANIGLSIYNSRELVALFERGRASGTSIEPTVIVDSSATFEHWVNAVQYSGASCTNDKLHQQ